MKLWIIKLGKAFSALREEGIVRGGARVAKSFFALFRRVGSGDILFVTGGLGDSARYRTDHVAEELSSRGFKCAVTVQDNPLLYGYAHKFSVFVFHRTLYTPGIKKLIDHIKEHKKTIIFDTDDLVYDKEYLRHMDMFRKMNAFEKMQYENGVGGEIVADPYVKVCTTTTAYLAEKLRERGKRVILVPNRLSKQDVSWADKVQLSGIPDQVRDDSIVIGYFSGTKSHDKDFAVAAGALKRIMEKHEHVMLFLAGPLNKGNILEPFKDRVRSLPYVPREEHFKNLASVDINIAPLEVGNPFCEAKSELKFFEAGAVGVPTVASATQTFCDAIRGGEDGFTAENEEEWFENLERLVLDADLRRRMGEAAKKTALQKYTTEKANNEEYYEFLRDRL